MNALGEWYLDYNPDLALSSLCSLFDVGCFDTTCAQGFHRRGKQSQQSMGDNLRPCYCVTPGLPGLQSKSRNWSRAKRNQLLKIHRGDLAHRLVDGEILNGQSRSINHIGQSHVEESQGEHE